MTGEFPAFDPTGISVVWILADSLIHSLRRPDARRAVYRGSFVACTPFGPDTPRGPGFARGRDRLVYGLAGITLVHACDREQGDIWSGAVEAIDGGSGRVAVWRGAGEGPGNEALEARGATRIESIDDLDALLGGEPRPVRPLP